MKTVLTTSLARAECVSRLRAAIAFEFGLPSSEGVKGLVWANSFGITKRLGWFARRIFPTRLRGRFEDLRGGGTRITCTSGTYVVALLFMTAWFGFGLYLAAVFDGPWLLSGFDPRAADLVPLSIFPVAVLAAGGLNVLFDRVASSGEREFLLGFLEKTLEAQPGSTAPNG